MKVAVVGAGWAGLAAAVELVDQGHEVTLFEAGRRPGGRARSVSVEGRVLDNGQHILIGAYRETLALMARVGVEESSVLSRLPLQIRDNAGFCLALPALPPPFNTAWALLSARGISWAEKLAAARWMGQLKRRNFRLSRDTTVTTWLEQSGQGATLRRHLWEPLCLAALNTPPDVASAQVFANVLRDSLGSTKRGATDLLLPRYSLDQVLPEAATSWLAERGCNLRFGHRIKAIHSDGERTLVDGETFASAIVGVAPHHLSSLLPAYPLQLAYEPIATVYLQYRETETLPYPLYGLQGGLGQWVVDRGGGLIAAVFSGHGDWEKLPDAALVERMHREIGFATPPVWSKGIYEKRATYSCRPERQRLAAQAAPGIFLAGDHMSEEYPATLEAAVRSGIDSARRCVAGGTLSSQGR